MPPIQSPDATTSFGARLRHERERRKISIESIAESTKILGALLEGLERDDVSRWPIGFYRRAFIRSYAAAIGLDPDRVLREFLERFPEPEETPVPVEPPRDGSRVRLTLPQRISWFAGGRLIARLPPRWGAVAFDAVVLGAVSLCLFVAVGAFWAPLSVAGVCYYFGGILLFGNSPGVCLFAPRPRTAQVEDVATAHTESTELTKFSDRAAHRGRGSERPAQPMLAKVVTGR